MKRALVIAIALVAAGLAVALPATGADDGPYKVRAVFDNGGFIVKDEEVRIAGARVGHVESVDVSDKEEIVSLEGGPHAVPGKAVVVMVIDDDGFKDFRADASCLIRPQSLIGEKFVDCEPTQPRAPGSEPPPELEVIEDGQPGEGQRLLPLENNGKAVDLDLIQNINRMPYKDRFRLIVNDLGAALAARGDDLGDVIDRANPALRETNEVLKILADQNEQLASLAADGDAVLEPLARNRTSITGFLRNASIAGQATAERGDDLEAGLQKLPRTLTEVRLTMNELERFSKRGTPLAKDLRAVAPDLSKATQNLSPLAKAGIPAFVTLGDAAESAGPKIAASKPVLDQLASLGGQTRVIAPDLAGLLDTFNRTNGWRNLMDFIYNSAGNVNGYDQWGHYLRAVLQITPCQDYVIVITSGCEALFPGAAVASVPASTAAAKSGGGVAAPAGDAQEAAPLPPIEEILPELEPELPAEDPAKPDEPGDGGEGEGGAGDGAPAEPETGDEDVPAAQASRRGAGTDPMSMEQASVLLRFLFGGTS